MLTSDQYSAKEDAQRILNSVKDSDNFEDILYQMYVRKKVEQGGIIALPLALLGWWGMWRLAQKSEKVIDH